jgi:hypothetical protein
VQRVPVPVVERAWRRLDRRDRLSFLADLWAARGFEVAVVDGRVRANRDGTVRWIVPNARGRTVATGRPGRSTEVAVGVRSTQAAGDELQLVDGTALRRHLLYAVDRADGERLAREHLGIQLLGDEWTAPPGASGVVPTRLRRALSPALVLALALVITGIAGGAVLGDGLLVDASVATGSSDHGAGDPGRDQSAQAADETGATATDPDPSEGATGDASPEGNSNATADDSTASGATGGDARQEPERASTAGEVVTGSGAVGAIGTVADRDRQSTSPPGVDPDGVVKPERLADAHETAIAGQTYGLWLWADGLPPSAVAAPSTLDDVAGARQPTTLARWVVVENRTGYRSRLEAGELAGTSAEVPTVGVETYAEGDTLWRREFADGNWTVGTQPVAASGESDRVAALVAGFVERYLSTTAVIVREGAAVDTSTTTGFDDGPAAYQLVARGEPTTFDVVLPSYHATATVRADGLVTSLDVEYYVQSDEGGRWVEFGFRYVAVGSDPVETPVWVLGHQDSDVTATSAEGASACTTADYASGLCAATLETPTRRGTGRVPAIGPW